MGESAPDPGAKVGPVADALAGAHRLDILLGSRFAFVAGHMDVVGFIALSVLFAAHVIFSSATGFRPASGWKAPGTRDR
ncbi:hypothetical protein P3W85_43030 [Cupriavidus basilensis]|uniref:Uncharacterized protein n=1 Tax=Cupriavidus basilensis TaxID=68895 RepID=A0ABT6B468_9BURK|nr:hypothetical protein [Cupriavidus basilensis]MDF3839665.1 hypothetical protein [Cupriavidus basilensis]